jgi:hypothetical protein
LSVSSSNDGKEDRGKGMVKHFVFCFIAGFLLVLAGAAEGGGEGKGGKGKEVAPIEEYPGGESTEGSKAEAKKYFKMGVEAFAKESYEDALEYFSKSYEQYPKVKVLYNIGMCQRAVYDFKGAVETFKRYLEEGKKKINRKKRKQVEDLVIEMESSLAQMTILTNENGASILVDGEEVGASPIQSIMTINPGSHVVEAKKEGFMTAKEQIVLSSGDHEVVSLTLVPLLGEEQGAGDKEQKGKPKKKRKVLMHALLWGRLGAALVGGGTAGGVLIWRNAKDKGGPGADWTVHGR